MTATRNIDMVTLESIEIKPLSVGRRQGGLMPILPSEREPEDAWSDSEIGRAYRLARAGWDTNLIAETMDIAPNEMAQKLAGMLQALERRKIVSSRSRRGTRNGKTGRPRSVSEEQEVRIVAMKRNHMGVEVIAAKLGLGVGCVRYVLAAAEDR